ncbi:MAG: riboflavin kinase, partial [Caldisericia bacterium]|nr:riboflavin kinase [Caldisericia bacterium]
IPPANLHPRKAMKKNPKEGVYITHILLNGELYPSITHIGPKPTFQEMNDGIETYLLSHSGNFYSQRFVILWLERIRDVQCFSTQDELVQQIQRDILRTQTYFKEQEPSWSGLPNLLRNL